MFATGSTRSNEIIKFEFSMKKLLIVSDTPTHPVTGGNRTCILQNAEMLRQIGFDVYFLYVHNYDAPNSHIAPTREHWGDRFLFYRLKPVQHFYRRVISRLYPRQYSELDYLFPWGLNKYVNSLHKKYGFSGMLVNYVWLSKLADTNIPNIALYTHDVFSNRAERMNDPQYCWRSFSVADEAKGIRRFNNILAIQNVEASYFKYLAPKKNVYTVYSPMEYQEQPLTLNSNILFLSGAGDANIYGLDWFVKEVLPLVRAERPEACLIIGGSICDHISNRYDDKNIQLMGRVDNPSDFYANGDVVINPTSQGTGLKIKTLEAIAHGKYTVVHPHSAEGIFERVQPPVNASDSPKEFANRIVTALGNREILNKNNDCCKIYLEAYNRYISIIYNDLFF